MEYSVSKLAVIAGISIRTLHYYDKIGLLTPAIRAQSRYRYYGKEELYRLQQILFFKELGFELKEIKKMLDDPEFDQLKALVFQKKQLAKQSKRLKTLIQTIDKTIQSLVEYKEMDIEKDLYKGLSKNEREAWREVEEKYDKEVVQEAKIKAKNLGKEGVELVKLELAIIAKEMAAKQGNAIDSNEIVALMKRQHTANEAFYNTSAEMFKGLGDMYVSDPRFTQFYDDCKAGTAQFMRDAMHYYADNYLSNKD